MIYRLSVLAQRGYLGKCFWETGACGLGWSVPAPPRALTLALSRRAGEGTVVVGGGTAATRVVL